MATGEPHGSASKTGRIVEVCRSERKGVPKRPVGRGLLVEEVGLEGDAHAGTPGRQVSLLCVASMRKIRTADFEPAPGDLAENLTVEGVESRDFQVGALIRLGRGPVLEVTRIGKECHAGCAIRDLVGDCVMPREGVFARVVRGGEVAAGDTLEVTANGDQDGAAGGQ